LTAVAIVIIALILSSLVARRTLLAHRVRRLSNSSDSSSFSKTGKVLPLLSLCLALLASVGAIVSFAVSWNAFGNGKTTLNQGAAGSIVAAVGPCTWMLLAALFVTLVAAASEAVRYWATSPMRVESRMNKRRRTASWGPGMGKWGKMPDEYDENNNDAVPIEDGNLELGASTKH
jgi:hypothetical protein